MNNAIPKQSARILKDLRQSALSDRFLDHIEGEIALRMVNHFDLLHCRCFHAVRELRRENRACIGVIVGLERLVIKQLEKPPCSSAGIVSEESESQGAASARGPAG